MQVEGQDPARTCTGTAGDVVTRDITHSTVGGQVHLRLGDGTVVQSELDEPGTTVSNGTLPETGSVAFVIDPAGEDTGALAQTLHH